MKFCSVPGVAVEGADDPPEQVVEREVRSPSHQLREQRKKPIAEPEVIDALCTGAVASCEERAGRTVM